MGKIEGFNERRSEGSMFSSSFFNKIKQKVGFLKNNFLENEDMRPSRALNAGVQGLKAGLQAIEEADREGLIGDHLTPDQKYTLNQIALQGDNVEPDVDEQGKLTLSIDDNTITADDINNLAVAALAPEKEKTTINNLAMQARELGKQGEDFRSSEVLGSIKSLVSKGNIDALLKNDITGTGTTPLEDISTNHPDFANLSYASLGLDPTGLDLNGDGIINEDEKALLSNSDREKIIKADPNILTDYLARKIRQSHAGGKVYYDKQNPKKEEEQPKEELSAERLLEKYSRSSQELTDGASPMKATDPGESVQDSLHTVQRKINVKEIWQPLEDKYTSMLDGLNQEKNDKIDFLYNDLNVTRFDAGEFKTQEAYDIASKKTKEEVEKIKQAYQPKIDQIQKDYSKESIEKTPNLSNQVWDKYTKIYDKDVKKYKKGQYTFEEMKQRYPNISEKDLK
tara:strand:- start:216 stop:1577 length:1362 start_codon:yes stop_codon:yes gene_type:complete